MMKYRFIMYERATAERNGGVIDVPAALVQQTLTIAGITDPTELGETELEPSQVDALANLLGFRLNLARYHYLLETLAADPLRT